jgi:hypothetical protein
MLPMLRPGSIVVAISPRRYEPGDVVIIRHNNIEKIKRITGLRPGRMFVSGDNPSDSIDSRQFGWLPSGMVTAKVIWPKGAAALRRDNIM